MEPGLIWCLSIAAVALLAIVGMCGLADGLTWLSSPRRGRR